VRMLTLRHVLGEPHAAPEVRAARQAFGSGPIARALLEGHGEHVYAKWQGAFWRLTALVELDVPPHESAATGYFDAVLAWLGDFERRGYPPVIRGRARAHAVWHGHALAAAVMLGRTDEPVAAKLAEYLIRWQWPDGGWNCDRHPDASCSSVYESLGPMWGLAAYHRATGDAAARQAVNRAAEFFLERHLFRSRRTGDVINSTWLRFRQPTYYHYDVLHALWVLGQAGFAHDPRADEALDLVAARRRSDGRWNANGRWWRPPGQNGSNVEAVDWGSSRPSAFVTLKALTVLASRARTRPYLPAMDSVGVIAAEDASRLG